MAIEKVKSMDDRINEKLKARTEKKVAKIEAKATKKTTKNPEKAEKIGAKKEKKIYKAEKKMLKRTTVHALSPQEKKDAENEAQGFKKIEGVKAKVKKKVAGIGTAGISRKVESVGA